MSGQRGNEVRGGETSKAADTGSSPPASTGELAVPELASVEVRGMTREAFLARATLAAGAAWGLGAVAPFVHEALAEERTKLEGAGDLATLNFALTLELVEQSLYDEALARASLGGRAGALVDKLRRDEAAHVGELRRLIGRFRGRAVTPPTVSFGTEAGGRGGFLGLAQTIEDTVVFAMHGMLPNFESKEALERLAALAQVDARHAALVALARGEDPAPKAFEDRLSIPQARDRLSRYVLEFGEE
ncbi:MAG TPA: ferritin-like domain-containing protein [Thermoleophilaceae bacterium]|nr:ferritin-like domain-containing protein [Thermoleophilaceae bacterium]